MSHKTYTIAIVGNYNPMKYSLHSLETARVLGEKVARLGAIVATNTSSNFGEGALLGAHEAGGITLGFSPASSKHEHEHQYRLPTEHVSIFVYTGFGYLGSDLVLLRSVDIVVVFLGDEKLGHDVHIVRELQKPLLVFSFEKDDGEVQKLLGNVYEYAEIYDTQQDIIQRLQDLIS